MVLYFASIIFLVFKNNFFKVLFIYFLERGKGGRERGRETSMCCCLSRGLPLGTWPTTQACALTGNRTSNPLVHRAALNPLSHTSQGSFFFFFFLRIYIRIAFVQSFEHFFTIQNFNSKYCKIYNVFIGYNVTYC